METAKLVIYDCWLRTDLVSVALQEASSPSRSSATTFIINTATLASTQGCYRFLDDERGASMRDSARARVLACDFARASTRK